MLILYETNIYVAYTPMTETINFHIKYHGKSPKWEVFLKNKNVKKLDKINTKLIKNTCIKCGSRGAARAAKSLRWRVQ